MIDDISLLAKAGLGTGRLFHMPGLGSGAPSV
jgi:hypothetical protein